MDRHSQRNTKRIPNKKSKQAIIIVAFIFLFVSCIVLICMSSRSNISYDYKKKVVDTAELQIVIVDVELNKNTAIVELQVTAKQMDTVLHDCGWEEASLNNYRFGSVSHGSLFDEMDRASVRYVYCDTDPSLADNQFYLVIEVTSSNGFDNDSYTLELQWFGIYDKNSTKENDVGITTVYEGPWIISIDLTKK